MEKAHSHRAGNKAQGGKALTVDLAAFFRELEAAPKDESGALTSEEVAGALGIGIIAARTKIKAALKAGMASVKQKPWTCMDGRVRLVPAYVFGKA